jgi:hypothetical protein
MSCAAESSLPYPLILRMCRPAVARSPDSDTPALSWRADEGASFRTKSVLAAVGVPDPSRLSVHSAGRYLWSVQSGSA